MPRWSFLSAALIGAALVSGSAGAQAIRFDPHVDLPPSAASPDWKGDVDTNSQFDIERARRGGLNAVGLALFVPQGARDPATLAEAKWALRARYEAVRAIVATHPAKVGLAASPGELRRLVSAGKLAIVETLLNAWPFGDDLNEIDRWAARGVRIFGFVHAGNNQFADSSRPSSARGDKPGENGGLSPLGRAAVARLNDLGVLIDVSQLSEQAFAQVLALSRAPVIASHSALRSRVDAPRNLDDAQLDAIKAKGGVVAIVAFSPYLHIDSEKTRTAIQDLRKEFGVSEAGSEVAPGRRAEYQQRLAQLRSAEPRASVAELVETIDYAVKRIGIDHVAISSDFNHGGGVTGWSDVGQTANLTGALQARGYSPAQIDLLWGGNLLRVWQAAIDARDPQYRSAG